MNSPQPSDGDLLVSYRESHDLSVMGLLFKRYSHLVFGVCMKYLKEEAGAKDAVMQIFEKLITDLKKHEITYFKSWLYQVAKNHCLMNLRSKKKFVPLPETLHEDDDENTMSDMEFTNEMHPDGMVDKESQLVKLEETIKQLKEEQRICVELFFIKEKSYREICEITGFSYMEVKSNIQNGRRNLEIRMKNRKVRG